MTIGLRKAFADHHRYSAEDAAELVMLAEQHGYTLLTTEKDHARMAGEPVLAALAAKAQVLAGDADDRRSRCVARDRC